MATYDLKYPGAAIDAILDTAYDLQNAGYIFRGLASEYSNTPTERSWVLAGEGETGHGFTSPVPKGYIGVCVFNGTSWTGKLLKCVSIDSTPTNGSTNAVSSGGAYASISQLADTVNEALDNLTFTDTTPSAFLGEYITEKVSTTDGGIERILTYFTILAATTSKAGLLSAADKAKLDAILTNLRSLEIDDTTSYADLGDKIVESIKATIGGTEETISTFQILAATASKAGLLSAADKAKLDALWSSGYQFAGIAIPSTTPISTTSKIFYIATEAGTYFNAVTVTQGINILSWNGTSWSAVQVVGIDDVPTEGSGKLVESGGVFAALNPDINYTEHKYLGKDGNLYDTENAFSVSDYYFVVPGLKIVNSRASNAVSSDYTFLCFYDINKNFISRLRRDSESTQSTDYTLLAGDIPANAVYFKASVEYGNNHTRIEIPYRNVALAIDKEIDIIKVPVRFETGNAYLSQFGKVVTTSASSFYTTLPIMAEAGIVLHNCHAASSAENTFAAFYDVSGNFVGALTNSSSSAFDYTVQAANIPDNAVYMRATMYSNGYVSGYNYYADVVKLKEITDDIADLSSVPVGKLSGCYLKSDGSLASVSLLTFCVTDFCPVKRGIEVIKAHRASAEDAGNTILCFYDGSYNFISNITADSSTTNYTIDTIPSGAVYFRATVWDDGYVNYKVPVSQLIKTRGGGFTKMFDYGTALGMDKDVLINSVETASNGRCTVIYDDEGYPSLMYKIPKVSIGALVPELGTTSDVHPAFIVNETEKDYIYMSVFMTSLYDGHYVSWFGLQPAGHIELPNLREGISSKGDGWHLETIYERSLLALLTMKLNSPTPTGNTNNGMSHLNPWEYCQLANGNLPGDGLPSRTGIEWINGTQPSAWSHNKELWGIQDVIGGYHRICDLMKLVNGKIYLAPDNNFFKKGDDLADFEDSWEDTGAAFDYIGNNIVLNTSVTNPMSVDSYVEKSYQQIGCTTEYDSLSSSIRKKLSLLLMAPKLLSTDTETVLGIDGRVGINNNKELCYGVFGGAEEYEGSGLGSQITAYPIDDNSITGHNAHYNMGSRIVYIP